MTIIKVPLMKVVGQEYDNVVAVLDQYFFYDENGKLNTRAYYYDATKMLFQMVTRARKKLNIIIINYQVVLNKHLEISHSNKGGFTYITKVFKNFCYY